MNKNLKKEFGDYLEANGFTNGTTADSYFTTNRDRTILVTGDSVSTCFWDGSGIKNHCSFDGLSNLDINGFIFLMHITGMVTLKEFKSRAVRENKLKADRSRGSLMMVSEALAKS